MNLLKIYYACKDKKDMYWRDFGGTMNGSYVLETKYLFANYHKARELAKRKSLRIVEVSLIETGANIVH